MADADTIIHLKTTSDNSGAKETEKALDGVKDAAGRAAGGISKPAGESMNLRRSLGELAGVVSGKVKGAFTSLTGVVSTAAKAIGGVTKALGVIGFAIQGVQLVIDAYKALKEWLNRSKKEAEELAKTLQDARIKASVDAAIASYIRLNGQIAETLRMEGERVKIADQQKKYDRSFQDSIIDNEEQKELNALDRNDPDYDARAARKLASERASLISRRDQLAAQMSEAQKARELASGQLAGAWTSYERDSGSTPAEMQRRYQAAQRAESAAEKALRQADSTIEKTARQMELVAEKLSRVDEALGRQSTHNDEG